MVSKSKIQTQKFAAKLAKKILTAKRLTLNAKIVALHGDLGSGKTTFVQGFMKALGVKQRITSPTFVIFRKYPLKCQMSSVRCQVFANAYHFDLYRIHKPKEILSLGFRKIIHNPQNIVLIEWPEKIEKILPKNTIWIRFEHGKTKNKRIINIR